MNTRMHRYARFQRGVAAVELALILPLFLLLLALPLYFGRVFWHYTTAQKAAHDSARYLSTVPLSDLSDPQRLAHVVAVAQDIVNAETAELNPGRYRPVTSFICDGVSICDGFTSPLTVTVVVRVSMDDIFFSDITTANLGVSPVVLTADSTFPTSKP